ncbi:RagB/SusD family nutrient uptake outer membrane protein [Zobellia amurskyensis]|uniref:RagB/SusD family nutrient uptake outer membrane protein n=1 Tax=Zobellia amurskyensis TaxID=248905 RepID=A0A7X2ZRU3_9FLAO|nr:RagB/SusD family nutrient uptake outer membrane protein [Zobellia amurskyensis]MUH35227.1 RagB/SusD family nutrient uptake outer membrane protein [Zobellia amurskyensis]
MKKIVYTLITVMILAFTACKSDDFLEPTPYGLAGDETFFRNESDALLAINATYRGLRQWYNNFQGDYGWGNIGTDDAWKGGASPADQDPLTALENYNILTTVGEIVNRWPEDYQGIRNANKVITNVPNIEMDEALKTRIIGEAYFLRGAYYFDLVRYFGGVPIYRENFQLPDEYLTVGRSSEQETWDFIEENMLEAISRLPKKSEYAAEDIGRATKGSALGFLVRLKAIQNDMAGVKKYSEQLFALGEYELAPTYREIFQPAGENGSGSIFEVQFKEANEGGGAVQLGNATGHAFGPRSGGSYGGWGFTMAKQELLDEFEDGDPRLEHSFYNVPGQPYAPLDGVNSYFGKKVAYAPYSDYPIPAQAGDGGVNWRVLRLADIYLMYAEAVAESDPSTAVEYVNKVRRRAREGDNSILPEVPAGTTGQALIDAIRHERRVELNLEGLRKQDLLRWGRTDLLTPLGFIVGKHEKVPIPQVEIDNYGGVLEQNPGY